MDTLDSSRRARLAGVHATSATPATAQVTGHSHAPHASSHSP